MKRIAKSSFLPVIDVILINIAFFAALLIRYDGRFSTIHTQYIEAYTTVTFFIILICTKLLTFAFFRLYNSLWKYASIEEGMRIIAAVIVGNLFFISSLYLLQIHFPRSVYLLTPIFDIIFIGGVRFNYRMLRHLHTKTFKKKNPERKNVCIIGGGEAGAMVIREIRNHVNLNMSPTAIIDDDKKKHGQQINGIPIVGGRDTINETVTRYGIDIIIIAVPSAPPLEIRHLIELCNTTSCKIKILPGIYEIITGDVSFDQIRDVQIEDLLGRAPVVLDNDELEAFLSNKRICVTGGGGSIGAELCRQIARFHPEEIIILDSYENSAYDLENELKRTFPALHLSVVIASVRDKERMISVFTALKPHVVFHAAAHKHVPLMEHNPSEAIKNNVFGTINTIEAAVAVNTEKFVLISTDKAVNPTNVMGTTKRICEMAVQAYNGKSSTEFVAVRFGNVLGSNGSVIPLFKRQIETGGPITVTHPDIIRYFMTIPEAAQLVLQAGAMAQGGEVFILDMGEPVKIVDLARNLIKLSGLEPDIDIRIEFTGLRPGEKLYEELLLAEEGIEKTRIDKIFIGNQIAPDYQQFHAHLANLSTIVNADTETIIQTLQEIVPTYTPKK